MSFTYSIVIPTTNNRDQLTACLDSILRCSPMEETEVIVVDNGSSDGTADLCEIFKSRLGPNFCYTFQAENQGFCRGTNLGVSLSTGKYIVWLNDDTLVTPGWLEGLRESIDLRHITHSNIGLAGPRSNRVAGEQIIKELMNMPPHDLPKIMPKFKEEAAKYRLETGDGKRYNIEQLTSFLSGFCLMMKREVIDKIGSIDERFSPGGFCDNDFVTRAIRAGFGAVISQQAFVYHAGSQTLNRLYPEMRGGVKNWSKYIAKYRETGKKRLLVLQRVKIDTDTQLSTFKKCAFRNADLIDGVIILSDKSEHKEFSESTCRKIFGKKLLGFMSNPKHYPLHEIRDRLELMKAASNQPHEWAMFLDHDECFARSTTRERLDELMNPIDPALAGYTFLFNNYWRGDTMVRTDGPWGSAFFSRMWKNGVFENTLRPLYGPDDKGFHCGNRPMSIPADAFRMCDVIIDHYGYADYEESLRKREQYIKNDNTSTSVQQFLAGSDNYEHLQNEIGIKVLVPKPFSISLNAMIKNEEATIGVQILNYASIVREFVICDTGSTDQTKELLTEAGIPFFEMEFKDDFSAIRNEMIQRSKGSYIMHVDADESPEPKFLEKIVGMLNSGPDLCASHLKTAHPTGSYSVVTMPRIFKNDGRFYYYGRVHETLDKSVGDLQTKPSIMDGNLQIFNPGLLINGEKLKQKLSFYGRLLEMEIQDHPDNVKARFELSLHYQNIGRTEDAIKLLQKAIEIKPDFARAKLQLATIYANTGLAVLDSCEGTNVDPQTKEAMMKLHQALDPWRFSKLG